MNKKHKKVCTTLNHFQHFFILASVVTECISISAFASLVGSPLIGITNSAVGLKSYRCWSLFPIKLQASYFQSATFIKNETSAQVISDEFCEIFKKTFF